jgi:hypothetical protein
VIPIPEDYIVQNLYQCVSHLTYNKHTKVYNGSCPFCKEGESWGKKTRFFYIPRKELAYCHNCGYSKKAFNFLLELTGKPFNIIINEIKSREYDDVPVIANKKPEVKVATPSLPDDCINLSDISQLKFYESNAIVKVCLDFIKSRRLNTAINKPKTMYLSLTDFTHKNRLIIPFYDLEGNIVFYQSRALLKSDSFKKEKYISKVGGEKSLAGIENVKSDTEHIFLLEGPIDSYFIKNGLAVVGIQEDSDRSFGEYQRNQLASLTSFTRIWCLDNQWSDLPAFKKTSTLVDQGEKVFIWPKELKKYKDFNDICIDQGKDEITQKFVLDNTFSGLTAKIKLIEIKNQNHE